MTRWRSLLAGWLLIGGCFFMAAAGDTGNVLWAIPSGVLLILVPALIVDEAQRPR